MSLIILGVFAFDTIKTPYKRLDRVLGGTASYNALSASYFKRPINLISVVGSDFLEDHEKFFKQRGVDMLGVQRVSRQTMPLLGGKLSF